MFLVFFSILVVGEIVFTCFATCFERNVFYHCKKFLCFNCIRGNLGACTLKSRLSEVLLLYICSTFFVMLRLTASQNSHRFVYFDLNMFLDKQKVEV